MATITTPFIAFKKEYILQFDTTSEIRGVIDDTKKEVLRLGGCLEELSDKVNHLANSFSYMGKQIRQTNGEIQETLGLLNKLNGTEYSIKIQASEELEEIVALLNSLNGSEYSIRAKHEFLVDTGENEINNSHSNLYQPKQLNTIRQDKVGNEFRDDGKVVELLGKWVSTFGLMSMSAIMGASLSLENTTKLAQGKTVKKAGALLGLSAMFGLYSTIGESSYKAGVADQKEIIKNNELQLDNILNEIIVSKNKIVSSIEVGSQLAASKDPEYSIIIEEYQNQKSLNQNEAGEAYNAWIKKNYKEETSFMQSTAGIKERETESSIASYHGALVYEEDSIKRELKDFVYNGNKDTKTFGNLNENMQNHLTELKEKFDFAYAIKDDPIAGAILESIKMELDSISQQAFLESDLVKMQKELDSDLAANMMKNAQIKALKKVGEDPDIITAYRENFGKVGEEIYNSLVIRIGEINEKEKASTGQAFGMAYVPYDNFPALLHQGERVLTAGQARTADGQARRREGVVVNIGDVYGNTKNDAYDIARILVSEITRACEVMV